MSPRRSIVLTPDRSRDPTSMDASQPLAHVFNCLVRVGTIISSAARGWSAFAYAAAPMDQVPLLFTLAPPAFHAELAYSMRKIRSHYLGAAGAEKVSLSLNVRTRLD